MVEGQPRWILREEALDKWGMSLIFDLYAKHPTLFSIKLHHGGALSKFPGRKYVGGTVTFVDQVNSDYFSVHEIDNMIVKLGYSAKDKMYYHFKKPGFDLDFGLLALGNDEDVLNMLSCIGNVRLIFVYIEHGITTVSNYFRSPVKNNVVIEVLDEEPVARTYVKRKRKRRLYLEWKDKVIDANVGNLGDNIDDGEPHVEADVADGQSRVEGNVDGRVEGNVDGNVDGRVKGNVDGNVHGQSRVEADDSETVVEGNVDDGEPHVEADVADGQSRVEGNVDGRVEGNVDGRVKGNVDGNVDGNADGNVDDDYHFDEYLDEYFDEFFGVHVEGNVNSDANVEPHVESEFEEDMLNQIHDVEVDMSAFIRNLDSDRNRVGTPESRVNEPVINEDVIGFDFDEYDSGDDEDGPDRERRRELKLARRVRRANEPELVKGPFYVGQVFHNKKQITDMVRAHAVATRRDLRCVKSDNIRVRAKCCGPTPGYTPSSSKGKNDISESSIPTCPWTLHVSKGKREELWMVKTLNEEHKCTSKRELYCCNSNFLSKYVSDIIKATPGISGKGLKDLLEKQFQIGISQNTVYKATQKARKKMQGAFKDQYMVLRDYILELQEKNPETTVKIEVQPEPNPHSETRVFKRIYVCLGALKNGFKALKRELIGLDGAFMKGPYPGQILSAVGVDSNNGIYPVAYAIVEAENLNSWTWFLTCLGDDLGLERNSNYTFITDRQKGLLQALANVFPAAEHRFCVRHLYENMNKKFKGTALKNLVWTCATRTTLREFESAMDELKEYDGAAHEWLRAIPVRSWARAHFSGRAHCDILLNNLCESFNSKLVNGRDQPIISCLEYIREYMMKRIVLVQKVQDKSHGTLTPNATLIFESIKRQAGDYVVTWNGGEMYQCNGPWDDQVVVNMSSRSCACRRWDLTGIPCKHAVAALWNMSVNGTDIGLLEDWVHQCYRLDTWKEAYSFKIQPTNGIKMWPRSECPTKLMPPLYHTPIGRPKKKRNRGASDTPLTVGGKLSRRGKNVTCGRCGNIGHNQVTCKGERGQSSQSQGQGQSEGVQSSQGESQMQGQRRQSQRQRQGQGGRGLTGGQPGRGRSQSGVSRGAGGRGRSQTGLSRGAGSRSAWRTWF